MSEHLELPETMRLHVVHLHPANSTEEQRKNSQYRTIARVYDRETNALLAEADARCRNTDSPNRHRGYDIAVGRAIKKASS